MKKLTITVVLLLWAVAAFATEQFKNLATTTTTGQTNVATTLVVASATLFPSSGTFTVYVDSGSNKELERVTAVSGTTFTVTRGLSPTSAVAHSSGVQVVMVQSAESFTQLEADAAAAAAQPGYINTPTVSAGAATLLAQCVVAGCTDYNRVANGSNTGTLTLTTPAAAGLHDGEALDVEVDMNGTNAPSSIVFTGGSGVTLNYGVLGNAFNATSCGTPSATGQILAKWIWNGTTGDLTLRGCAPVPASTTLGVALGGTGLATLTAHDVYVGNGTSAPTAISPSTSGFVLTSNGTSADPSFQAAGGSGSVYCTDNWSPGAISQTFTAGHTYCPSAVGTYTFAAAATVNVADVSILCSNPDMVLQRTGATALFNVTAAGFRLIGCSVDGNTQTAAGTGPLINLNGANDAIVEDNVFTNTGTTNTQSGTIWVQAGLRDRIIHNTFSTSQTDTAIWVNSQSGTNTVNDLIVQDNKIPTMAPATNLYAIAVNQNTGNVSTNVKVLDNTIALTNTHAEGIAFFGPAVVENTALLGADVSGNHVTATAAVPRMVHLFGFDYGTIARNVIDDGGNIVSGPVLDLGDTYNTAVVGNEISGRSATEAGLVCIDCAQDAFTGNTIDGIGNADPALQVGSNSAASSNNAIVGNTIRMAFDGIGIEVQANGAAASFNTVVGNTVIGNDKNNPSTGIEVVDSSGGAVKNAIVANNLTGWGGTSNTCLSVGSGASGTYVANNNLNDCTTFFSDSGSATNSPTVGVTAPTITAGCTAGGGNTVAGTDYSGVITTGATAATTCTMTFNHTWSGAPHCTFTDANASITPVGYSAGAVSTTTAVVDFASAGNKKIAFSCGG